MKLKLLILSLLTIFLVSCTDGEDGLKQQTTIQSDAAIAAENKNQQEWAEKLGADLKITRDFINAIEGEYEGEFLVAGTKFKARLVLSATIPAYELDRIRTLAELEYELQNLKLNIQVVQWNSESDLSAVGCVIQDVLPDRINGILNLLSESCSNTYQFFLAEADSDLEATDNREYSRVLATMVRQGQIKQVDDLVGKLRSSTNAKIYNFKLKRK